MPTPYFFPLYREEAAIREEVETQGGTRPGGTKGPHDPVQDVV